MSFTRWLALVSIALEWKRPKAALPLAITTFVHEK